MTFNVDTIFRKPNSFEREVLAYIREHPGLLTAEIAEHFGHTQEAYDAIAFLWAQDYAKMDRQNKRITA